MQLLVFFFLCVCVCVCVFPQPNICGRCSGVGRFPPLHGTSFHYLSATAQLKKRTSGNPKQKQNLSLSNYHDARMDSHIPLFHYWCVMR